jgi:hypothetical protein
MARLDRLEALVARLCDGRADMLSPALRRAAGFSWVTAGEVWRLATAQAEAAQAMGEPKPELAEALEVEGIRSAHGLGRWLASREGDGFERGGVCRGGVLWLVQP